MYIWLTPQWLCRNSCTWATVHLEPNIMCPSAWVISCHKAIVVITGRAHCFHDNIITYIYIYIYICIYITLILLLWDLSTVVDHLWPLIYIYIVVADVVVSNILIDVVFSSSNLASMKGTSVTTPLWQTQKCCRLWCRTLLMHFVWLVSKHV